MSLETTAQMGHHLIAIWGSCKTLQLTLRKRWSRRRAGMSFREKVVRVNVLKKAIPRNGRIQHGPVRGNLMSHAKRFTDHSCRREARCGAHSAAATPSKHIQRRKEITGVYALQRHDNCVAVGGQIWMWRNEKSVAGAVFRWHTPTRCMPFLGWQTRCLVSVEVEAKCSADGGAGAGLVPRCPDNRPTVVGRDVHGIEISLTQFYALLEDKRPTVQCDTTTAQRGLHGNKRCCRAGHLWLGQAPSRGVGHSRSITAWITRSNPLERKGGAFLEACHRQAGNWTRPSIIRAAEFCDGAYENEDEK
jgi:hypothetical protein